MATTKHTTLKSQDPENFTDENKENKPAQRGIWVDKIRWKKLQLIKDALGNWNRFADVAVEQLLASGLISEEVRNEVHKINRENGIDFLDDSGWRESFQIYQAWPTVASNIKKIKEELVEIKNGLGDFAQAVEDHATAMLEAELVRPYDTDTDS